MLRGMAESKDRRVREAALRTMLGSAWIRGRREVAGAVRAAMLGNPPGEKHRTIFDAKNDTDLPGTQVRDEGDAPAGDPAVNEAYDGLGATYDMYSEVFQRNSIDGRGMRLIASVHYRDRFNNAFWDGERMVFGDGDGVIFVGFTKAIDVIGHELTHGVTENTAALEYHDQPGALNESVSDVFGSLVKQHALNQDAASADWLIGSGILAPGIQGQALRSMSDPGSAYDDPKLGGKDPQPKHMNDFVQLPNDEFDDYGGVHINSGIPNHAFYLLATAIGGNAWEDAGSIWYNTLLQLHPTAQFQDCANISAQVAAAQFGNGSRQHQAVQSAWEQVGVPVAAPVGRTPHKKRPKHATVETNGAIWKKKVEQLAEQLIKLTQA
jgi:Zn-dependent metalloprotease